MELIKFNNVENRIITLRDTKVIIDSDVAELYCVQTKEINQAIKNNPEKFPDDYTIELTKVEKPNWSKNLTTSINSNSLLHFQKLLRKRSLYAGYYIEKSTSYSNHFSNY